MCKWKSIIEEAREVAIKRWNDGEDTNWMLIIKTNDTHIYMTYKCMPNKISKDNIRYAIHRDGREIRYIGNEEIQEVRCGKELLGKLQQMVFEEKCNDDTSEVLYRLPHRIKTLWNSRDIDSMIRYAIKIGYLNNEDISEYDYQYYRDIYFRNDARNMFLGMIIERILMTWVKAMNMGETLLEYLLTEPRLDAVAEVIDNIVEDNKYPETNHTINKIVDTINLIHKEVMI